MKPVFMVAHGQSEVTSMLAGLSVRKHDDIESTAGDSILETCSVFSQASNAGSNFSEVSYYYYGALLY